MWRFRKDLGEMNVCGSTGSRGRMPIVLLLTASGSGLVVVGLSAAKEDTLTKALVVTLPLALFQGGLNGTVFLEFACHAASACGVLLCIMPACFKTIEVLLGTTDFALCLFELHLVQGEL
jgi:hypothetical protein